MKDRIDRVNKVIDYLGITKHNLATSSGIAPSNLNKMMTGESSITDKTLHKICEAFPKIDIEWLRTGEGEMIINNSNMQQNNNTGNAVMANDSRYVSLTTTSDKVLEEFISGIKAQNVLTERSMDQTDKALSEISEHRKLMERLISIIENK